MEGRPRLCAAANSSWAIAAPQCTPFPPGLGRAEEGGLQSMLSSIRGHTVFAMHGFSWLLSSPLGGGPGGEATGVPEAATWFGTSPAHVPFKLGSGVGQPLSAGQPWSQHLVPLVSSVCSCSCAAGLSFKKRASWRLVMVSLLIEFVMCLGGAFHHLAPPLPLCCSSPSSSSSDASSRPSVTSCPAAPAVGCLRTRGS